MKNTKLRKAVILLSIFFSFCSRISFADTHEKIEQIINHRCFHYAWRTATNSSSAKPYFVSLSHDSNTTVNLAYKINSNCFESNSSIRLKIIDFKKSSISEKNILNLIFSNQEINIKEINLKDISIEIGIGKCIKIELNSSQDYNYNLFIYII